MRKIFLIIVGGLLLNTSFAQTDVDALRYSHLMIGGTARGLGVGGAFGALGGDFTSISINPAGLGLYRSSEAMMSMGIGYTYNKSNYFGNENSDYRYNFNLPNFGLVFNTIYSDNEGNDRTTGWISSSIGIGMNRVANFNSSVYFSGKNNTSSMLDYFLSEVNSGSGTPPSQLYNSYPFSAGLAYDAFLINPTADTTRYNSVIPSGTSINQSGSMTAYGGIDEYVLSTGGNYNNKLYLGAVVGISSIKYKQEMSYSEINNEVDTIYKFVDYTYSTSLKTNGAGVNMKIGMIYRVNDNLRLGGAIHTPTLMGLTDTYVGSINSRFLDRNEKGESPNGKFEYTLITPWRTVASASYIFNKVAFLTFDYEFVDYSQSFYNFNNGSVADKLAAKTENQKILNKYGQANNIRLGGEYGFDMLKLRAGYAFYQSPFKNDKSENGYDFTRHYGTLGFGIREGGYYIDFAYVRNLSKEFYLPYQSGNNYTSQGVKQEISRNTFVLTMGLKF